MIFLFIALAARRRRVPAPAGQGSPSGSCRTRWPTPSCSSCSSNRSSWGNSSPGAARSSRTFSWLGEPVNLRLAVDGFSLFMLFTISLVGLCVGDLFHRLHGALRVQGQLLRPLPDHDRRDERPGPLDRPVQRLPLPRSGRRGLLRPGRLRARARRARGGLQVPHALGRRLGLHPHRDRRHLRRHRRA